MTNKLRRLKETLVNNIQIKGKKEVPLDKTAEILSQMNQYLKEEKKKIK